MSFSDIYERLILDKVLGRVDFVPPATVYLALSTTAIADDGSGITEPVGGAYDRVAIPNDATNFPATPAAQPSTKTNGLLISLPVTTAAWGDIVAVALMDAATGGVMIANGEIVDGAGTPTVLTVGSDVLVRFQPGTLRFRLD